MQGDDMTAVFKYGKYSCRGEHRVLSFMFSLWTGKKAVGFTSRERKSKKEGLPKAFSIVRINPASSSGWLTDNVWLSPRAESWKSLITPVVLTRVSNSWHQGYIPVQTPSFGNLGLLLFFNFKPFNFGKWPMKLSASLTMTMVAWCVSKLLWTLEQGFPRGQPSHL